MSQIGARYLAKKKQAMEPKEVVCTQHYTSDKGISIPVTDGVRKRPKALRRKAD